MKRKTITAIIIAVAVIIVICFKFLQPKESPSFSIIGKWKLDTAYATAPVLDSIKQLIATVTDVGEKNKSWYHFKTDSTCDRLSPKDSTTEKYYLSNDVLYFDDGHGYLPHPLKTMNDGLVAFLNKDSVVFVLKKQ